MSISEIFDSLVVLEYSKTQKITEIQTKLYLLLQESPKDISVLILLMQTNVMLGQREQAKAISYKIWEEGLDAQQPLQIIFINNLINIGLIEMASQILKNIFKDFSKNLVAYYPIFIKFATLTGNLFMLQKTLINLPIEKQSADLKELINVIKKTNHEEHFKNIQKLILEEIKYTACAIEVLFDDNDEKTDFETIVFVKADVYEKNDLFNKINKKISIYFENNQPQYLIEPTIAIADIEEHWALNFRK